MRHAYLFLYTYNDAHICVIGFHRKTLKLQESPEAKNIDSVYV